MANTVKMKRSAVAAKVPTTSDLALGEIAINTYDGKVYIKKDNGTASIVEVGGGGSGVSDGDKGDITVSASGATWTIDAGVIGTAKLGGDITSAGKALLDDADAAAQRTTLGIGTSDSPTFAGLTLTGAGILAAGTVTQPTLAPTGDSNTGIWFPAADTIAVSSNGSERLRIGSSGQLGIGGANYGTAGQVLTSQGSSNTPAWSTLSINPAFKYISSALAGSGANLTFTNIPFFNSYYIQIKFLTLTNNVTLLAQLSQNNGTSFGSAYQISALAYNAYIICNSTVTVTNNSGSKTISPYSLGNQTNTYSTVSTDSATTGTVNAIRIYSNASAAITASLFGVNT